MRHTVAGFASAGSASAGSARARKAGAAMALAGAGAGLWFTARFIGGDSGVLASEWLGLAVLLAGLGAAVLFGYSRGQIARSTTIVALSALALWTAIAASVH